MSTADVDERDDDAGDDRLRVVDVVALEAADDAAVDAEGEVQRDVDADDEQHPLAGLGLLPA